MSYKIGNVEIKNRIILAPMAGITNEAFFYIAKKYNAGLLCSEMVSDKGLLYHNKKTLELLKFDESLHPFSIQIFGDKKEELSEAAKIVYEVAHPDIIDINMGCSVPKVYKAGSGVSLMKDPEYVYEIIKALKEAVPIPITIKIRSGLDHKSMNFLEVAKFAEMAGCSGITLHPRTKTDLFKGSADWSLIKKLKETVKIPVIGSGDIKTPMDAKRMLDETGCDFVMIGRAAQGNPFIFKEIDDYLNTGSYTPVSNEEKFDTMIEHYCHLKDLKGEKVAILEMRSHAAWYVKGMKDASIFKVKLNDVKKEEDLLKLIDEFRRKICEE